ncbi:MAG: glutamate-1-semialdehyde 2,1-aminomutase [Chlamydiota bacterium]|nr:glutamate-1-semialdehyde 2,1-aminomutase [Chlamydiota bacterium]
MKELWEKAKTLMPGGVNSPVRAFGSVDLDPFIVESAKGPYIYDIAGNQYIDLVMSWGPMILGHAHPEVLDAVCQQVQKGTSYGAICEKEIALAELILEAFPSIQKIRFTNSGTEASMTAIRIARAATNRNKIIKFDGCYHGHVDTLLTKAGSGLATQGLSGSQGVPSYIVQDTIVVPYNDLEALSEAMNQYGDEIAAIVVEPIAANMGLVMPKEGFLQGLRSICNQYHSLLIFDEVITGFRIEWGGAQTFYSIAPDLTILGKIIGGGFPVGAVAGKKELMDLLAPVGPVYHAGTLSGNPVAMVAGLTTINILKKSNAYQLLEEKTLQLRKGFQDIQNASDLSVQIESCSSLMTVFFAQQKVTNYTLAKTCNVEHFKKFYQGMLRENIFLPPSQYEAFFVSIQHDDGIIEKILNSARKILVK